MRALPSRWGVGVLLLGAGRAAFALQPCPGSPFILDASANGTTLMDALTSPTTHNCEVSHERGR
jgi:hypothetical protein